MTKQRATMAVATTGSRELAVGELERESFVLGYISECTNAEDVSCYLLSSTLFLLTCVAIITLLEIDALDEPDCTNPGVTIYCCWDVFVSL